MSLRVWLPLNGDLHNQGLDNITVTNSGATVATGGKIGKNCYQFGTGTSYLTIPVTEMKTWTGNFSVSCWVKIITWNTTWSTIFSGCSTSQSWTNIIFGLLRNSNSSKLCFSISNNSSYTSTNCITGDLSLNTWYHFVCVYETGQIRLYQDGELVSSFNTSIVPAMNKLTQFIIGKNYSSYQSNTQINDFRIYDHALSAKEVKEISKALVLHYPLDDVIQELDNCYAYPTFDTSNAGGGWSHWGSSGHDGHYGQNTDKQYIFNKANTYSHWVSNGSTATHNYLVYQSPAFDGGYRSAQFIIKEENSLPITESICYPTWNNRDGGVPNNQWTSIKHLGDGFYLCKVEGLHQDGNNDLIGVYVCPNYKIYISEGYCENDKTVCSDIFFPYSNTIYDCSGYGNNGTINGMLSYDSNTTRYFISTLFDGIESSIKVPFDATVWQTNFTMNLWFKKDELGSKNYETLFGGQGGFEMDTRANTATTLSLYMASTRGTIYSPFNFGEWYMVTMINNGTNELYYINGELVKTIELKSMPSGNYYIGAWKTATQQNYKGNISDFRLYATALSADDIKELYDTGMSIDDKQNIHTYELDETYSTIGLKKTGVLDAKDIFTEDDSVGIYKSGLITANQFYER